MKIDYLEDLKFFLRKNNSNFSKDNHFIISKFFYKFRGNAYSSFWQLSRRVLGDFVNHKDIVLIGADGAGKSTIADILHQNTSLYVNSNKKYLSGFYYPSGRTNLFLLPTALFFSFLKSIKDLIFYNSQLSKSKTDQFNILNNISTMKSWRSIRSLEAFHSQLLLIIFIPLMILDAWLHRFVSKFGFNRIDICDRYYDDIVINYTNTSLRKIIRFLIPSSKYKLYLYAMPEEHFLRKKNEDIEMILYMQKCYSENDNYLAELPTNINSAFINKKILTIVLNIL